MGSLHNKEILKGRRKALRNNGTSAEAFLWKFMKGKQLGSNKFRRQHSIGYYIVDFYCFQEKLIVEVDGSIHNDPLVKHNDGIREDYLKNMGCRLLRFTNQEVFNHPEMVVETIRRALG